MLERDLSQGLQPVGAPEELWVRVEQSLVSARPAGLPSGAGSRRRDLLPHLALAAVAIVAVVVWSARAGAGASQVREWVAANSGLDLALADRGELRLAAAHTAADRAEMRFTVDGREGKLVVTKAITTQPADGHPLPKLGATRYSWTMRGLAFTLECGAPEDLRAACQLCHA
jgi:hypothetical protein